MAQSRPVLVRNGKAMAKIRRVEERTDGSAIRIQLCPMVDGFEFFTANTASPVNARL
jgi:hypothetical protein